MSICGCKSSIDRFNSSFQRNLFRQWQQQQSWQGLQQQQSYASAGGVYYPVSNELDEKFHYSILSSIILKNVTDILSSVYSGYWKGRFYKKQALA
jgi:hypothetical protein